MPTAEREVPVAGASRSIRTHSLKVARPAGTPFVALQSKDVQDDVRAATWIQGDNAAKLARAAGLSLGRIEVTPHPGANVGAGLRERLAPPPSDAYLVDFDTFESIYHSGKVCLLLSWKTEAAANLWSSPRWVDAAASSSDQFAFECIMRRHNRLLFRTGRSILKGDADTEDALQEAYLRAWRGLVSFRADAKLSTWLVRIVINESLGRLRRRGAQVIPLDSGVDVDEQEAEPTMEDDPDRQPERLAMRAEVRLLIEARIDTLPDAFRIVFMLRAVEELSVEETAVALEIPEATVRTRFFRARSLPREGLSRDVDLALGDAFSFDGERCDRSVANVLAKLANDRESAGS